MTDPTTMVKVDVEYCGICNFASQCRMLQNFLLAVEPDVEVVCHQGRRGAFEVKINDTLVHSKLQTLAFPQHASVLANVQRAARDEPLQRVQEAPIENCLIM